MKDADKNSTDDHTAADKNPKTQDSDTTANTKPDARKEHGGPKGLEPTRYGDWERNGRCTDF